MGTRSDWKQWSKGKRIPLARPATPSQVRMLISFGYAAATAMSLSVDEAANQIDRLVKSGAKQSKQETKAETLKRLGMT